MSSENSNSSNLSSPHKKNRGDLNENAKRKLPSEDEEKKNDENDSNETTAITISKRPKTDDSNDALQLYNSSEHQIIPKGVTRTSKLLAPSINLTGHVGAVYSVRFSPNGNSLASAGFDTKIFIWEAYGENRNIGVLKGHKNAVTEAVWTMDSERLLSGSADKTVGLWDVEAQTRIKQFKLHRGVVNTVSTSRSLNPFLASGSDDKSIILWDARSAKHPIAVIKENYPVLSLDFSLDSKFLYSSSIGSDISCYDLRNLSSSENSKNVIPSLLYQLSGHQDSITGIKVSPNGDYLASNSMDNSVRIWDIRPFLPSSANGQRLLSVCQGNFHDVQAERLRVTWDHNSTLVAAGSCDRSVLIWSGLNGNLVYKLPGHKGSVNDVDFHPHEPIIASAGSDKLLWLGELN